MTRKNLRTAADGIGKGVAAYLGAHLLFMVAASALYYCLVPFAHAQTYVRPSKGAALSLFTTAPVAPNVWAGWPTVSTANAIDVVTQGYDWTSFEAAQIRLTGTGGAPGCTSKIAQYAVTNLAPYVRFRIVKGAGSNDLRIQLQDSPLKDPPSSYVTSFSANGDFLRDDFTDCSVSLVVVPLPFAQPNNPTNVVDGTVLPGGIEASIPGVIGGVDPANGRVTTLAVNSATRALKVDVTGSSASTVTVTNAFALDSTVGTSNTKLTSIDGKLTGVSTAANQSTANNSLSSIDTKLTGVATAANQSTEITKLTSIDSKLTSPLTVSLPTGAATSANQATTNTSLSSIDTKLTGVALASKQDTANASLASIDAKLTTPLSTTVSSLPATAATTTLQTTGNTTLANIYTRLGSDVAIASLPNVTIASLPNVSLSTSGNYVKDTPLDAVASTAPVSVNGDQGGIIVTLARPGVVTLQNVGAYGAMCSYNTTFSGGTVYGFGLKAPTTPTTPTAGSFDGGQWTTPVLPPATVIRCRATTTPSSNTTSIAYSVSTY